MNRTIIIILLTSLSNYLFSQEIKHHSAHKYHKEYFDSLATYSSKEFAKFGEAAKMSKSNGLKECSLEKIVFGWHPYWAGGAYNNYRWDMLSDFSYFSYEVDFLTGDALTIHDWETSAAIDAAIANNVRVNLCVTMFDDHETFFDNASAQQNLIDNLLTLVQNRGANGVNIDFEAIPGSETGNMTVFLQNLATQFHTADENFQISVALPAVDWADVYDIEVLKDYIDIFIIMGYDYYWSAGGVDDIAGPTGQLYTMHNFNYNQSRSITYYLSEGVPNEKLVLGVPYYGFDWQTNDNSVPTEVLGSGSPLTIKVLKNNSNTYYSTQNIDENSLCAYYNYYNGNSHQAWIDDEITMQYKYDIVLQRNIAGIGIWALGYDDGYTEMWDLIESTFSTCAEVPCYYNIYDTGGPKGDYYNREDYTYTIAPTNYTDYLALNFTSFDVESNFDTLWIYDGVNTQADLLGVYTGTNNPEIVEASGGAITIRFFSDGLTTESGWNAEWRCSPVSVDTIMKDDLQIYPNPANDFINIKLEIPNTIEVYSVNGKLIVKTENVNCLNTSNLKDGIYFIKLSSKKDVFMKKIIIQH